MMIKIFLIFIFVFIGREYAQGLFRRLTSARYISLVSTLEKVASGDETKSAAFMLALTSRLSSPNLPLSMYDKGQIDGILTSLGRNHAFLSLLLPNFFEAFDVGDANNGNQEIQLAPRQAVRNLLRFD